MAEGVREAMIREAWFLIAERGLEGMSTREVLARTGAPRGSVYHHFPRGRTELIELAIDHSRQWMQDQIAAMQARTPREVVSGYIDIWRRVVEGTDFRAGCAMAGATTGGHDPAILDQAEAAFTATGEALAARLEQAGVAPDEAAQRASFLVIAAEGAVILARARRSSDPLDLVEARVG
ncbi:TetR/AcrR family transcriptional regulator [Rathayibacter tanaceti]|uniref:TetR family transcriptional regulator n=2 Tax=Rathayibacter tanaceti TaxID=1671680 RepID=A0ACD2XJX6_9MICO|nr:TetR/AcrR family transcriptional regulator [Rathayibacter tanaceti]KZX22325.1 putative HTH-type transcriptional regulator YxaF [Rathayibacter tanaceti]QHC56147.1 TetR family transcriptional regulator [Rathayibacter tanaceti]TCO36987.1 TetR family transcriptional regulator [Rathayibacter tanaceti]